MATLEAAIFFQDDWKDTGPNTDICQCLLFAKCAVFELGDVVRKNIEILLARRYKHGPTTVSSIYITVA